MSAPSKEDVIRMARGSGIDPVNGQMDNGKIGIDPQEVIDLANSIKLKKVLTELWKSGYAAGAATEREACETACDQVFHQHIGPQFGEVRYGIAAAKAAIRARGQQ